MTVEIRVPVLGESVSEATIGKWLKGVGDSVVADEPLVELETDKVSVEVPSPGDGVLSEVLVSEGDTVGVNALLGKLGDLGERGERTSDDKDATQPLIGERTDSVEPVTTSSNLVDIFVPVLGESVAEATVGRWHKSVGDSVNVDDSLVELETDKVNVEVPSPVSGVLGEIIAVEGSTVEVNALLCRVSDGAGSATTATPTPAPTPTPTTPTPTSTSMSPSPSASRLLSENSVDSSSVSGSGKRGQVLKGDVISALESASTVPSGESSGLDVPPAAPAPSPVVDASGLVEERVPMTRLRRTIARRLKEAQNIAAMLTTFNEVDMGAIMELRSRHKDSFEKKHGVKLGFMGFFVKAVCHALNEIPSVNAEIDGDDIIYRNYSNIGVAVGTDKGLVVPVVRCADRLSLGEIEKEINRLGTSARDGTLELSDMQGGTFTISNGGVYGSLMSTPILNAPQSGILGMHKIQERPVAVDGEIVIRPMMYLALSYDHRIIDGKEAVTFLVRVRECLEDPPRLVLDV